MFIDDRKKLILKAIIDSYIDTAEPVGSRTIARKTEIGLSSATIRNEMSDLEEMGLLEQPHTSAGRIPSDKGYRVYVDQLMPKIELTQSEMIQIKNALHVRINELGQLLEQISAVISNVTKYTSMSIMPKMNKSILKTLQVLPVQNDKILVIVVTSAGLVKSSLVKIQGDLPIDSLQRISNFLNEKLQGTVLEEIDLADLKGKIDKNIAINKEKKDIIGFIMDGVRDCLIQIFEADIYLEGTANIFDFPEFQDILKARHFLNILNTKEILYSMMYKGIENGDVKVRIGTENEIEEMKDYSLVTVAYCVNEEVIGSIGVIGPTRMEYAKVISSLNYIKKLVNKELMKIMGIG